MDIDSKLSFGRYRGLSIRNVFCGTHKIDRELLAGYLKWRLKEGAITSPEDEITINMYNFEIDSYQIKVIPTMPEFNFDSSKHFERLFIGPDSYFTKMANLSLDKYCYDVYLKDGDPRLVADARPDYIEWCINNLDIFYINRNQINLLQEAEVNRFIGIHASYQGDNIYTYSPKVHSSYYKFDENTIKKNDSKAPPQSTLWY